MAEEFDQFIKFTVVRHLEAIEKTIAKLWNVIEFSYKSRL